MTSEKQGLASGRQPGRVRALLAGGLVLGVGAAFTLAAWTDDVNVHADFATGSWNVQGNVTSPFDDDPANWQDYATAPGGALEFALNPDNLSPGDTVYAPVSLRVDPANASGDATVVLDPPSTSGDQTLLDELVYAAKTDVPAAECNAADFAGTGTDLVAADSPLTAGGSVPFTLSAAGAPAATTPVPVCFAVTLVDADEETQGLDAGLAWTFSAESVTTP